ncbi:MAG TPA: SCP2 sterol-binding domain-containing protein [Candidatus Binataceae bacterium]|nr:SCP2 sterol-binding domain-containing protein [Candidatus Binataceae bacterium]
MPDAPTSCKQVFDDMPGHFKKEAAQGVDATFQFDLSGNGGGKWQVTVKGGSCEVKEGANPSPNVTISMAAQDYLDMVAGKLNPQMAFMTGKLKISGDMGLALKFPNLFS